MNRFVIDTNAFLRWLLDDIPSQANRVERLLKDAKQRKVELVVPQIVIFELVFALEKYYRFTKQEIIAKIKSVLAMSYLKVQNDNIFERAIDLFSQRRLAFVDSFLISFARQNQAELFSFDKDLMRSA